MLIFWYLLIFFVLSIETVLYFLVTFSFPSNFLSPSDTAYISTFFFVIAVINSSNNPLIVTPASSGIKVIVMSFSVEFVSSFTPKN